jgi:hypothetical protein
VLAAVPGNAACEHLRVIRFRFPAPLFALALAACANTGAVVSPPLPLSSDPFVDTLEQRTFQFFWQLTNPRNGLVPDRAPTPSFSSVAAIGFGLTAYPIGVERGYVSRADARARVLTTLAFLWRAPQSANPSAVTGYHGFYYHFLDMETGYRFQTVELSTIDTSLLLAGILTCREYFDGTDSEETAIRAYADSIYARVDWTWAQPTASAVSMGWSPEHAFIPADWRGYNEAMILYVLALGSPTHPIEPAAWTTWVSGYQWARFHGQDYVQFGPLFAYQYSHVWIDFRGILDPYMRARGLDYFENSRRATYAHRQYSIDNPGHWRGYTDSVWGLTASDGPADTVVTVDGVRRQFHTYWARGASTIETTDDGTIVPTAAASSIAFAPEIVIPAIKSMRRLYADDLFSTYGFVDAFNPTFAGIARGAHPGRDTPRGWFDIDYLGIDQGPIIAMTENYRTGLIWRLMRKSPYIRQGLRRAGFTGGWLDSGLSR